MFEKPLGDVLISLCCEGVLSNRLCAAAKSFHDGHGFRQSTIPPLLITLDSVVSFSTQICSLPSLESRIVNWVLERISSSAFAQLHGYLLQVKIAAFNLFPGTPWRSWAQTVRGMLSSRESVSRCHDSSLSSIRYSPSRGCSFVGFFFLLWEPCPFNLHVRTPFEMTQSSSQLTSLLFPVVRRWCRPLVR
jgi:hypothetical protein